MLSEVSSVDDGQQTGVTPPFMCIRTPLQQQIQPPQSPQQQPLQLQQQQQPSCRTISPGWRSPGAFVMMPQGNPNSIVTSKLDRVKNGLSTVSNRVSPVPAFLPPPPPQGGGSLMTSMHPARATSANCMDSTTPKAKRPRGRKKKDDSSKVTSSNTTPSTSSSIVVKNRFKHSRPLLAAQNSSDLKRPKNALEMLATSYSSNSDVLLPQSSTELPVAQRYNIECPPNTSIYSGSSLQGSPLLTITSPSSTAPEVPQSSLSVRSSTFCPSCGTPETCIGVSDISLCLKCNHRFTAPTSRPKNCENLPMTNTRSFYSLAHMPQANVSTQPAPQPIVKRPRAKATKRKKQAETIDLISDSDGEKEEDSEASEENSNDSMSATIQESTGTMQAGKLIERMKMPGGVAPENNSKINLPLPVPYRSTETTPLPHPSPTPSPLPPSENMPLEYKFNCNRAMFGELYGETITPTRCADNRVYLSLQCQMYRDNMVIPEKYTLSVGQNDVQQFLVHFGRVPSFVAIETSTRFAEVACKRIGKEVLVPASPDPKKRYIILALVSAFKVDSEAAQELTNLLECLSPWARINVLNAESARKLILDANLDVNQLELCFGKEVKSDAPVKTILVYQPGSKSGGIPVTTEDVACLAEGTYLNDIIIDFYLKYLYESILSPEQRAKTYVFNSYFYKRLTQKQGTKFSAEQMHGLVKNWTRNVDLFEKDFIVIPVNEHCHWYLVVISFPGGAFISEEDLSEKEEEEEEDDSADFVKESKSDDEMAVLDVTSNDNGDSATDSDHNFHNNNAKMTGVEESIPGLSEESRSEASEMETSEMEAVAMEAGELVMPGMETYQTSASETELSGVESSGSMSNLTLGKKETSPETNNETSSGETSTIETNAESDKKLEGGPAAEKVTYKQAYDCPEFTRPCILIFDSLVGSGHSRVFTNLRHYLTQEWAVRKPTKAPRIFDKSNMKGCYPKIPRQNNDCDCGVFLLQYVESFFTKPIKCFRIPVHLESWFTLESMSKKRSNISALITQLAEDADKK